MSSSSHNLSVLFADVVGSTRLYERLGDTNAFQAISTCLAEIERATKANKGPVVKTPRHDNLAVLRTFSKAAKEGRRCLIPVTGFFEWMHVGKEKVPHFIHHVAA